MLGYLVFIIGILIIDYFQIKEKTKLYYGWSLITVFVGIRYGIGYDYNMYAMQIDHEIRTIEYIPSFFVAVAKQTHFSIFFMLCSAFTSFFFLLALNRLKCTYNAIYLYIGYPCFMFASLSIVRQCMAYSVIFYMLTLINRHNDFKHIMIRVGLIFLAFLCHSSALIGIFALLPTKRITQKQLWILWCVSIIVGALFIPYLININTSIFLIKRLLTFMGMEFSGGFYKNIIVALITIAILFKYDYICRFRRRKKYVVWSIWGACFSSVFVVNGHLAERCCTFYFVSILALIDILLRVYRIPKGIYVFTCFLVFLLSIYIGHITSLEGHVSSYYPYRTVLPF